VVLLHTSGCAVGAVTFSLDVRLVECLRKALSLAVLVKPRTFEGDTMVAAGAVVGNDVPGSAIVAGIPAKVIGYRFLPDKVWHLGNIWFSPNKFDLVD